MDLLICLTLLGYCLVMQRFLRWPIESTPFATVSMVIVLFFLFASLNILYLGSVFVMVLGGIALLASPWYLPKKSTLLFEEYLTPGFLVFLGFSCVFGIMAHSLVATGWDELPRWLAHPRLIYLHNGLWLAIDHASSADYPPGSALFHYLFLRLNDFSEDHIFFAQLLLTLSPLALLLKKYRWPQFCQAFIIFSLLIIFLHIKVGPRGSLYMDQLTALFFGGSIAAYYILNDAPLTWLFLALSMGALVLFKPMLYPFILVISAVIFCDLFYLVFKKQKTFLSLLPYLAILILPLVLTLSWQHYVTQHLGIGVEWQLSQLIKNIANHHLTVTPTQLNTTLPHYLLTVLHSLEFLLFITIAVGVLTFLNKDKNKQQRLLLTNLILTLSYLSYIGLLLLLYYFMMDASIVLDMESFGRFIDIFNLAWIIIFISQALYLAPLPTPQLISKNYFYIPVSLMLLIYFTLDATLLFHRHHQTFAEKRSDEYIRYTLQQQLAPSILNMTPDNARIAIIWQGWGMLPLMINYELLPRQTTTFTLKESASLMQHLNQYDYVLSASPLPSLFWQHEKFISPKPILFVKLTLCLDANLQRSDNKHCQLQHIPFYFYKVNHSLTLTLIKHDSL